MVKHRRKSSEVQGQASSEPCKPHFLHTNGAVHRFRPHARTEYWVTWLYFTTQFHPTNCVDAWLNNTFNPKPSDWVLCLSVPESGLPHSIGTNVHLKCTSIEPILKQTELLSSRKNSDKKKARATTNIFLILSTSTRSSLSLWKTQPMNCDRGRLMSRFLSKASVDWQSSNGRVPSGDSDANPRSVNAFIGVTRRLPLKKSNIQSAGHLVDSNAIDHNVCALSSAVSW